MHALQRQERAEAANEADACSRKENKKANAGEGVGNNVGSSPAANKVRVWEDPCTAATEKMNNKRKSRSGEGRSGGDESWGGDGGDGHRANGGGVTQGPTTAELSLKVQNATTRKPHTTHGSGNVRDGGGSTDGDGIKATGGRGIQQPELPVSEPETKKRQRVKTRRSEAAGV